jgi:hypothetical protein
MPRWLGRLETGSTAAQSKQSLIVEVIMHEPTAAAGKLGFPGKNQGFRAFPAVDEPLSPTLRQRSSGNHSDDVRALDQNRHRRE